MEDLEYLGRLKESQQQFLVENQRTQDSRKKLLDDYGKLKEKLQTLPDTVSQPAMVPIGDIAFFPGTLIHTNEIMVLIGDNWFVERSAKQAAQIIDRRIKLVSSQLEELVKEHKHIKSNLDYTAHFERMNESGDVKEIKEEIPDDDYERKKGKKRIAHKPKHSNIQKKISFKTDNDLVEHIKENLPADDNDQQTINHDELMSRLNQLEREEQEAETQEHEKIMESLRSGSYVPLPHSTNNEGVAPDTQSVPPNNKGVPPDKDDSIICNERRVKFENIPLNSLSDTESDELHSNGVVDNLIRFEHTDTSIPRERSVSESDLLKNYHFNSPADIYEHFARCESCEDKPKIKSILKKDSRSGSTENLKLRPILKTSPEHRPGTPENTLDEPQSILKTPPDTQASDKRPGTPENVLDGVGTHSILKTTNEKEDVYIDPDVLQEGGSDRVIPILKGQDSPLVGRRTKINDHFSQNDDKRSILKNSEYTNSSSDRTFSPEVLYDNAIGSNDNTDSRKSILTSPDCSVCLKHTVTIQENTAEPKPILKYTQESRREAAQGSLHQTKNEAFSGRIVERNTVSSPNENSEKGSTKKPMSKFKASRMKK